MSSLEMSDSGKNSGRKKKSIRVDFTPLVDLGFLLITFFMLTTSMLRPSTMEIQKPKPSREPQTPIKTSQAMTLFLTKNDKIVYFFGMPNSDGTPKNFEITDFGKTGIRRILRTANTKRNPLADSIQIYKTWARQDKITEQAFKSHRAKIESQYADKALVVLIKAEDHSRYNNMVDILDEMSIANIRSYALMDISPNEAQFVHSIIK